MVSERELSRKNFFPEYKWQVKYSVYIPEAEETRISTGPLMMTAQKLHDGRVEEKRQFVLMANPKQLAS